MTELLIYISWLDRQIKEVNCGIRIEFENKGWTVSVICDHTNVISVSIRNSVAFIIIVTAHLCMTVLMRTYDIKTAMESQFELANDASVNTSRYNKSISCHQERRSSTVWYALLFIIDMFFNYFMVHLWPISAHMRGSLLNLLSEKAHPTRSVSCNGTSGATWMEWKVWPQRCKLNLTT